MVRRKGARKLILMIFRGGWNGMAASAYVEDGKKDCLLSQSRLFGFFSDPLARWARTSTGIFPSSGFSSDWRYAYCGRDALHVPTRPSNFL
jgi:hypothetical protein